jgi:hypothetical protein
VPGDSAWFVSPFFLRRSGAQALRRSPAQALTRSGAHPLTRSGAHPLRRSGAQALRRSGAQALRRSGAHPLRRSGAQALTRSGANRYTLSGKFCRFAIHLAANFADSLYGSGKKCPNSGAPTGRRPPCPFWVFGISGGSPGFLGFPLVAIFGNPSPLFPTPAPYPQGSPVHDSHPPLVRST